jgi:imidazolonepropionase-like amidohydrolase
VQVGFTLEQAWAAATFGNAAALPEPKLGMIEPGAPANLVAFRDDPTRNLDALSTLEAVVANGRFYSQTTLDEALAIPEIFQRLAIRSRLDVFCSTPDTPHT